MVRHRDEVQKWVQKNPHSAKRPGRPTKATPALQQQVTPSNPKKTPATVQRDVTAGKRLCFDADTAATEAEADAIIAECDQGAVASGT